MNNSLALFCAASLLGATLPLYAGEILQTGDFNKLPLNMGPDMAQDRDNPWVIDLGLELGYEAEFAGSDDYEVQPMPDISISYTSGRIRYFTELTDWGVQYLVTDRLLAGAALSYEFGRAEDDSEALKALAI